MRLNKNKKGLERAFKPVLIFGIMIFIFVFAVVGMKQIMLENIIQPTTAELVSIGTGQMSAEHLATLETMADPYEEDFINYDMVFLIVLLSMLIETIGVAYLSQKKGIMSFLGLLTLGSMIMLFVISMIEVVRTWLFDNIIYQMFNLGTTSTPIIDWFVNNSAVFCFVWFLVLILINQLDIAKTFGNERQESGELDFEE